MKIRAIVSGAVAAFWLAGSAMAQPVAAPPDAVRLKLAHDLMQASGGEAAVRVRMAAMFEGIQKLVTSSMPADTTGVSNEMFKYVSDEEMKAIPQMLNDTAEIYAEHLTEGELRAMLAWTSSPEAQSIQRKLPLITQEVLLRQQPLLKQMLSGVFQRAADRACAESHCTPDQQKQLVAMMSKIASVGDQTTTRGSDTAERAKRN